jgi:hypothetical protein
VIVLQQVLRRPVIKGLELTGQRLEQAGQLLVELLVLLEVLVVDLPELPALLLRELHPVRNHGFALHGSSRERHLDQARILGHRRYCEQGEESACQSVPERSHACCLL